MNDIIETRFSRYILYSPYRIYIFVGLLSSKERLVRVTILITKVISIIGINTMRLLWISCWHKIKVISRSPCIITVIVIVRYKIKTFAGLSPRPCCDGNQ